MRLLTLSTFCFLLFTTNAAFAQQKGWFLASNTFAGYNYISPVYHIDAAHAPTNRGYNVAFNYGGIAGYKLEKIGVLTQFSSAYFQQKFKQNDVIGSLQLHYLMFGGQLFYQINAIGISQYHHTIKLGYTYLTPQFADYIVKNSVDGTIYAKADATYQFGTQHMITAAYGISTGYRLFWADLSVVTGINLNNIYKPLTNTKGNNFFIGLNFSFGLFVNTNK